MTTNPARSECENAAPVDPAASAARGDGRGFTLVELLVVIVIIVILVGLLIPALSGARSSARKAATQSSMQSVLAACASFKTDKQRNPGAIPVDFLGLPANDARLSSGYGISMMQSAILDLAGGVAARGSGAAVTNTTSQVLVTFPGNGNRWVIETGTIGMSDGPQYLKMGGESFRVVDGRMNRNQAMNSAGAYANQGVLNSGYEWYDLIPEMVDAEGMPILMWQQDPLAQDDAEFADIQSTTTAGAVPGTTARPKFNWMSNSGILSSTSIGKRLRNQAAESAIGDPAGVGMTPERVQTGMRALLGSPQFSIKREPPEGGPVVDYPSKARGEIVLHAAGADGVFLGKRDAGTRAVYGTVPVNAATDLVITDFDDYTAAQ